MQLNIRRFDIYRKIPKDLTQPTNTGGTISICCIFFIVYLLIAELYSFMLPEIVSQLYVHNQVGNSSDGKMPVHLDITVYGTKCDILRLDIQDDMGNHAAGHVDDAFKTPMNNGNGCRMRVKFRLNRVPGNFHVGTHGAQKLTKLDMSHYIHSLVFGDHVEFLRDIPDSAFNSLANVESVPKNVAVSQEYIMKIVPTLYETLDKKIYYPFQYTHAHREYAPYRASNSVTPIPATIWFRYELNPITIKYTEHRQPIYHFLTMVLAIVGGTFTVAGIIDSFFFTASETLKKYQEGKLG